MGKSGDPRLSTVATKMSSTSPRLELSKNWMALRMFMYKTRPCATAPTMVAKLSSVRIMAAASLLTSVPVWPMATPMSARLSAGASFTPSPVMATTSPQLCHALTMRTLCSGDTRA